MYVYTYLLCIYCIYKHSHRSFFTRCSRFVQEQSTYRCEKKKFSSLGPQHSTFPARPEKGECPPVPPRAASAIPEPPGPEHLRGKNSLLTLSLRKFLFGVFTRNPLVQKKVAFTGQPTHQHRVRWGGLYEPDATVKSDWFCP